MATTEVTWEPVARTTWRTELERKDPPDRYGDEGLERVGPELANLISSLMPDGRHAPAIDIDLPCRLYPSRTVGHFHLYIDKAISWRHYRSILRAMTRAGIVEKGYYRASKRRKATFLRPPGPDQSDYSSEIRGWFDRQHDKARIQQMVWLLLGVTPEEASRRPPADTDPIDVALKETEKKMVEYITDQLDGLVADRLRIISGL